MHVVVHPRSSFSGVFMLREILLCIAVFFCSCNSTAVVPEVMRASKVLILDEQELERFPNLHNHLIQAVHVWAAHIPVHFVISYNPKAHGTKVQFIDLAEYPYQNPYAIGMFDEARNTLSIQYSLEGSTHSGVYGNRNVNVIVHEIGHMLGLPHITSEGTACHNTIQVKQELAERSVMYPLVRGSQYISSMEIALLKEILDLPESAWQHPGCVTFSRETDEDAVSGPTDD
jgi:hypothetical protein